MKQIFLVIEKEEEYRNVIAVCSTEELANKLVARIEEKYNNLKITEQKWSKMWDLVNTDLSWVKEDMTYDSIFNQMHKMFPDYSVEDFKLAERYYEHDGYEIEITPDWLLTTEEEINKYHIEDSFVLF